MGSEYFTIKYIEMHLHKNIFGHLTANIRVLRFLKFGRLEINECHYVLGENLSEHNIATNV